MKQRVHALPALAVIGAVLLAAAGVGILLGIGSALADNPPPSAVEAVTAVTNQTAGVSPERKLDFVFEVTLAIIGFGLLNLVVLTFFWRAHRGRSDEFVRIFAISLVIFGSLVLVVAGHDDVQIAPAFGLFGSIVGYLFGRANGAQAESAPPPPEPRATP